MLRIDIFKTNLFLDLEKHNSEIREVCSGYKFAHEGQPYDFNNKVVSYWFDPDYIRELHISEFYPDKVAMQFERRWNLLLYISNFPSLFIINELFKDRKDILIEEQACGMGNLAFFLRKLGFNNFHFTEQFTQLCKSLLEDMMKKADINYILNKNDETNPVVMNLIGWPFITRSNIPSNTELIGIYNNSTVHKMNEKGEIFVMTPGGTYLQLVDFVPLCKDNDNLATFYCRKDKFEEFSNKLEPYSVGLKKKLTKSFIPQYEPSFGKEEQYFVSEYLGKNSFLTEFKEVKKFEEQVAKYLNVKHAIMVSNGTVSLSLALLALGIKPGDKVIVPNLTMIATPNAVRLIGAIPVLVDVDERSLCLDVAKVYDLVYNKENNIKGVIYVSLNGRCDYTGGYTAMFDYLRSTDPKIAVIEDAAQSFGSCNYKGRIGGDAQITSFSLSPPKIISTGQGGILTTNDDELAESLRRLKDFGRTQGGADIHDYFGINCKVTDIQGIIGQQQLKDIHYRTLRKKQIYHLYHKLLKNHDLEFIETNLEVTVPWFVDIYFKSKEKREQAFEHLLKNDIGTRRVYPPIHTQKIYSGNNFVKSVSYSERGLWLPSSLNLTDEDIYYICDKIREIFK